MTFGLGKDKSNRDKLLYFLRQYDNSVGISDKKNILGLDAWSIITEMSQDKLEKVLDIKVYPVYSLAPSVVYVIKHSDMLSRYNEYDGVFNFDKRFNFKNAYKFAVVAEELEKIMPNSCFSMDYTSGLLYCKIGAQDNFELLKSILKLPRKHYIILSSDGKYVINTNYLMVECE